MTIRCFYSCEGCGSRDVAVDVPERASDDMDVREWMEDAVRRILRDHRVRNPFCRAKAMQEIKIPVGGAQRIGGPKVH